MAAPTNTISTAVAIGNREDLENMIYMKAAQDCPFTASIGKQNVTATKHEWQTQSLRAAAANVQVEGDDVGTLVAGNLTTRVGNYTQILWESFVVSGTQEAVNSAGRDNEVNFQKAAKGLELANDLEKALIANIASVAGQTRKLGGALAWITSNDSRGSGGSDGGYNTSTGVVDAATNGTQRALTESLFKNLIATGHDNGAKFSKAFLSVTHKQLVDNFTGNATNFNTDTNKIVASVKVYMSSGMTIELVATQSDHGMSRDILFIDPSLWAVGTLRPMFVKDLAVSGDNIKKQIIMEKTLICKNQKGSGVIADLTTSGL